MPDGFFPDRLAPTRPALHTSTSEYIFYRIAPAGPYAGIINLTRSGLPVTRVPLLTVNPYHKSFIGKHGGTLASFSFVCLFVVLFLSFFARV